MERSQLNISEHRTLQCECVYFILILCVILSKSLALLLLSQCYHASEFKPPTDVNEHVDKEQFRAAVPKVFILRARQVEPGHSVNPVQCMVLAQLEPDTAAQEHHGPGLIQLHGAGGAEA